MRMMRIIIMMIMIMKIIFIVIINIRTKTTTTIIIIIIIIIKIMILVIIRQTLGKQVFFFNKSPCHYKDSMLSVSLILSVIYLLTTVASLVNVRYGNIV